MPDRDVRTRAYTPARSVKRITTDEDGNAMLHRYRAGEEKAGE
jgi:hypothetical protein